MYRSIRPLLAIVLLCLLMTSCGSASSQQSTPVFTPTPTVIPTVFSRPVTPLPYPTYVAANDACPKSLSFLANCQTPQSMRVAYGMAPLIEKGFTGKGQTIIDIVSFGSPTLQKDLDVFSRQFGLPALTVQQISPLNEPISDPNNDRSGWAVETTLDVEIIHALAPEANIVVLTSPVAETEGTVGMPEFRQLLQYAIDHKLGKIVSNSWGASELTFKDAAGQAEIQKWDALLKQATTEEGMTILASSGDNGSTDYEDVKATHLSPTPTTSFATSDPWVTSVGGTSLMRGGSAFSEEVWNSNNGAGGGGFSQFFATPDYQKTLPASVQSQLKNRRGVPDVSGNADPNTGLAIYSNGTWLTAGGTSASAPMWAALIALANQMAGHPLGFINPALYKLAASEHYAQDFHDVTVGNNSIVVNGKKVEGYQAAAGWDAATGLGTPNGVYLLPDLIAAASS